MLFALLHDPGEPVWPGSAAPVSRARAFAAELAGPRVAFAATPVAAPPLADEALIRAQPFCVASSTWSSGTLGESVLFVHERRGDELRVGYFVYWSAERPWGDNSLTYTLLPALAIDAAYSHFMFVLPGMQRLLYGSGDVEGALVVYDVNETGAIVARAAIADDGVHREVQLSQADVLSADGRVVLHTDVWSHQLGARGGADYVRREGARFRCFRGESLQPMNVETARRFRLGSAARPLRARPAWRAASKAS